MYMRSLAEINESAVDSQANAYVEKYPEMMNIYESRSAKARAGESISPFDVLALGRQLDQYMQYQDFCEANGNLTALGSIPQVALEVITASAANSVLPLLSSTQNLPEEHGVVYFKQIKSKNAAGGYTKGEVISDPLTRDNPKEGNLGSMRKQEVLATTVDTDLDYAGNFTFKPVRPYTVTINVAGVGNGKDDGSGQILGFGFHGTLDYTTGAFTLDFKANPGSGKDIEVIYDIDSDAVDEIDEIQGGLVTKDIKARVWALKADIGTFATFAFGQRFGRSAADETAADLTNELTRILNTNAVLEIYRNAKGSTNWSKTAGSGVSYAEHKLTFIDGLAEAESVLHTNSGANSANRIIAGSTAAATLRGLPNFTMAPAGTGVSVGLFGYLDGIPVIRASKVIPDAEMVLVSNAGSYFNAPLVYAPFMPLMVTDTVQSVNNPFSKKQAAGVWAGMECVNGNLATKLVIT